jgi:NAD(P)-dependent dehydrogenase (short-subunit alcohol dehydrogenase family)
MMNDTHGLTCVVTGATSGIGFELTRILAGGGARVIGVGRSPERCEAAARDLRCATGNRGVSYVPADLSSLSEIRALAAKIMDMTDQVEVLANNAGTFTLARSETVDGLETQLVVNWLAGFMLTGLLMNRLLAAPAARVLTTSSGSHFSGRIHWSDPGMRRGYNGLKAYDQSKLATVLFTTELARRLGAGSPVSAYAVDPGLVKTDIGMKGNGRLVQMVWKIRTRKGISPLDAARSLAYCATDQGAAGRTGHYWKEGTVLQPSERALDEEAARRLWRMGEELCGVSYP